MPPSHSRPMLFPDPATRLTHTRAIITTAGMGVLTMACLSFWGRLLAKRPAEMETIVQSKKGAVPIQWDRLRLVARSAATAVVGKVGIGCPLLAIVMLVVLAFSMALPKMLGEVGGISVPTPTASRAIVQSSLSLRELWRRGGLLIPGYSMPAGVLATEKHVFFVDHSLRWPKLRLQVLDATAGQLEWQVADLPNEQSLATDRERLFIAIDWNIRAYNLSDGKLLWQTPGELPGHTGYRIYPIEQEILVYSTEDSFQKSETVVRAYNASNGTLKDTNRTQTTLTLNLALRSQSTDFWSEAEKLWAVDRHTGRTLWQVSTNGWIRHWPILTDSTVILSGAQLPGEPVELYAVDIKTGAIVWRYAGRCMSNFVLTNNTIYAIREDTALVGIDLQTGREVGAIRFTTTQAEDNIQYWVAATINRVFAYFGDSQELIAFAQ